MRLLFIALLAAGALPASDAAAADRPNVVFVFSDDVNRDSWGVYGNPDCQTPHIDRLAAEGMRFDRTYCTVAMCAPFRQELYSGRSPWRTGTLANHSKSVAGTRSLPHYLKPLGYRVGLIGKTHIGPRDSYPFEYLKGKDNDGFLDAAEQFIAACRSESKPFCLFLASHDGHAPHTTGDASKYPPEKLTVPPYWLDTPELRAGLSRYYAEVTNFDALVGRTRELLENKGLLDDTVFIICTEQGIQFPFAKWTCFDNGLHMGLVVRYPKLVKAGSVADNTLVVFTSDNGGMLNRTGQTAWKAGHRLNGKLLGFKFGAWEGGHRVPFIVRWPGRVPAGTESDALVSQIDLIATFAAAAGTTIPEDAVVDGVNQLSELMGEAAEPARNFLVISPNSPKHLTVRKGKWVYIPAQDEGGFQGKKVGEHLLGGAAAQRLTHLKNSDVVDGQVRKDAPPVQLYNLQDDPRQSKNVYAAHPEVLAELAAFLKTWRAKIPQSKRIGWINLKQK